MVSFLKLDVLKLHVAKLDEEVQHHLQMHWHGKQEIKDMKQPLLLLLCSSSFWLATSVVQEQEEIANNKPSGEALTWQDLTKMNYTWRVAPEILRMYPPMAVFFHQAMKDIEHEGFLIPKGWKVILFMGTTHMDESIFQNPSKFDPARFEKHAASRPPFTSAVWSWVKDVSGDGVSKNGNFGHDSSLGDTVQVGAS